MTEILRPDFTCQWSSGGAIVAPSNAKIQTGWTAEVPPFQWENWSQNRQDNAIVHLFQKGISVWSATQDYYYSSGGTRSFVQGSDGFIYEAMQNSTNQDPATDTANTYWKQAFRSQSGSQWYAVDTGTANTYKANYIPVVKSLVDGMVLKFKALNANTGASTFTPNNGVIAAAPIVSSTHTALTSGSIVTKGDVWLQWNTSVGGGSWVMITSTGGTLQPLPAGSVFYFAASAPPTGMLKANGALVSRTTYAALFATIGTTFGIGDGSTTFTLPDLRGEFIRGWDDTRGLDAGRAFASIQDAQFPFHGHPFGSTAVVQSGSGTTVLQPGNGVSSYTGGAGSGSETRVRNVALLACIKY